MKSWNHLPLRLRLPIIGVPLTVIPIVIITVLGWLGGRQTEAIAEGETERLSTEAVEHLAEGVFSVCDTQQALGLRMLQTYLDVARRSLPGDGRLSFGAPQSWSVTNQFTKTASSITLPEVRLGRTPIPQEHDPVSRMLYIDEMKQLLGSQVTIFQRMNAAGDMVRVATTVVGADGKRAIGTFIPAVMADGTPNGVLAKVLKGETYLGRAFVVDTWYQSGYEPLRDDRGEIAGMLFVGVPTGGEARVRESVIAATIGASGHAAAFDSTGKYIVSPKGASDGVSMWEAKDRDGRFWVQDLVTKAKSASRGELVTHRYTPADGNGGPTEPIVTRAVYFEPWDWIITVNIPEDELLAAQTKVAAVSRANALWAIGIAILAVAAAVGVWYFVAGGLSRSIEAVVADLKGSASQMLATAGQFARSAQDLSKGASDQAAALEETSASMEEMASMARRNAESARRTTTVMGDVDRHVAESSEVLATLVGSMGAIKTSTDEVGKIVRAIDAIALQTNILALNAAVEAARAGDAGLGFAVVADEVRNLAQRAAVAAKDTATLIEESGARAQGGVTDVERLHGVMIKVTGAVGQARDLFSEVATASEQQTQGIAQVATAVQQMEKVTQNVAATAEETAAASEELGSQAESTTQVVGHLAGLVEGVGREGQPAAAGRTLAFRPRQAA